MQAPVTRSRPSVSPSLVGALGLVVLPALVMAQPPRARAGSAPAPAMVETTSALLRGVLRDDASRVGLAEGAIVLLDTLGEPGTKTALSDSVGFFELAVPAAGSYRILVRRPGYAVVVSATLALAPGEVVEVELPIAQAGTVGSAEAMILAREPMAEATRVPEAFARRREGGRGLFLGPDELRRSAFRTVGDLVTRLARGWWGPEDGEPAAAPAAAPDSAGAVGDASGCHPEWFLNGERTELPAASLRRLSPSELRAAELYPTGAQLPPELAGPARCGAIVLWAR